MAVRRRGQAGDLADAGVEALGTFGQLLVGGLLTGLVFALVAVGLTLVYGVMDVVNFAHGEFLMLAMYATLGLALLGLGPLVGLPLVAVAMFLFGIVVYRVFVRRLLAGPPEATVFGTFGLLVLHARRRAGDAHERLPVGAERRRSAARCTSARSRCRRRR